MKINRFWDMMPRQQVNNDVSAELDATTLQIFQPPGVQLTPPILEAKSSNLSVTTSLFNTASYRARHG
jgi:hypothetical protein